MTETTKTKKVDELRKLIESNSSVSKFLDIMLDGEHTFFLKSYGIMTEPIKSLVGEAITDAGVLPTLTEDEKELVAGIIIEVLQESILKMPRHGTVSRAKKFFDTLYRDMNDDENFSAIVASYMQDVMMDGLVKNDVDGNLMAATITWIVCRSVLIPIVPICTDAKELHEEKESVEETKENPEQEEKKMIEEKEEPVIEPTSTKEEVSEKDGEKILKGLDNVLQSLSNGTIHVGDMFSEEEISRIREMTIKKLAPSTVESKDEGGTMQTSASTSYKEDKKEKADKKPEDAEMNFTEGNSPSSEIRNKLNVMRNLDRDTDEYQEAADSVLNIIDGLHKKYPNMELEDKQMFTKLLIVTIQAFQLGKHMKVFMDGMIDDHQYAHMLNYVGESTAAMEFREYGADDTEEYYPFMARDVIAYEVMKVAEDNMPTLNMYRLVDHDHVSRLVGFKYFNIHIMDQNMIEKLVANCDATSTIDAIITTLHNYKNIEELINVIVSKEVGDPINTFVRENVLGII